MLNLRYHHLGSIIHLESEYRRWLEEKGGVAEPIKFGDLYSHPEVARNFIAAYTQDLVKEAEMGAKGYLGPAYHMVTMEQWHDHAGEDGSGAAAYGKATGEFYLAILLADPADKIRVTYEPDEICGACQGGNHKEGKFGDHCHKEYRMFHEYAWDLALENTSRNLYIEEETVNREFHKRITEQGPTMEISLEIFRSQKFLTELSEYHGAAKEYVYKGLDFLECAGILASDDRGFTRVSDAYFRGERGN